MAAKTECTVPMRRSRTWKRPATVASSAIMHTIFSAAGIPTSNPETSGISTASTSALRQSFPNTMPASSSASMGLSIYSGTAKRCDTAGIMQAAATISVSTTANFTTGFVFTSIIIKYQFAFLNLQKYIFFFIRQNKLSNSALFKHIIY